MKDPRPLVDHVYEMYVDHYLRMLRIGGGYPRRDDYLFQSLYHESSIPLPGSPLHNHHTGRERLIRTRLIRSST